MQEHPPQLRPSEAPTPADYRWVFTMLSEGMVFLPHDLTEEALEREALAGQEALPITALMLIALMLTLLIIGQLS